MLLQLHDIGPVMAPRHLFAAVIACRAPPRHPPLSDEAWALVPSSCPGLLRALPTTLAHGSAQAQQLVRRLPPAEQQQLHAVLRCLLYLQRQHNLPFYCSSMIRDMVFFMA
jgi:hypothetical protein